MEIIDKKYNDVDVMHVHSGKIKIMFSTTNPLEIQGFVEQNLVNFFSRTIIFTTIIHYTGLKKVVLWLILSTLMKHTTQYRKTFPCY